MDTRYIVYFYADSTSSVCAVSQSNNLLQLSAQACIFSEDNPSGYCEIWDNVEKKRLYNMKQTQFG
jgi:hypothetical protein